MNVYVESNFVLEVTLEQEQSDSCVEIISLCQEGRAKLIIPAFALAEPFDTVVRHSKARKRLNTDLRSEMAQLARSKTFEHALDELDKVSFILAQSGDAETSRLFQTLGRILSVAELLELNQGIVEAADEYRHKYDLDPQDSIVYASVYEHLSQSKGVASCFLNRNSKDFDNPDIEDSLNKHNCKLLPRFDTGYNYILSQSSQ